MTLHRQNTAQAKALGETEAQKTQRTYRDIKSQVYQTGQDNLSLEYRKKIVFVLPSLDVGGAERVLITLMNHLDRSKFDPEFVVIGGDGPMKELIASDIPYHSLAFTKSVLSYTQLLFKLKKIKPDIVVTTMVYTNVLALLLKPFFPRTKFIVRESSMPSALTKEYYGWKGRLCALAYQYLYPSADIVLSPTMRIIDEFKNDLKISMINHRILYNPVDLDNINQQVEAHFEPTQKRSKVVRFICMGRLCYEKGFDRLIEALPDMHSKYDWKLEILGEGAERSNLESLIKKHNLQDRVTLSGHSSSPWNKVAAADCLIMPSRWEGMPNVALEALACGTKVLAMKEAGGIIEIDSMTPRRAVQTFNTVNELIEAMAEIKPLNKQEKAPSLLPERFSLAHIIEEFQTLLASISK